MNNAYLALQKHVAEHSVGKCEAEERKVVIRRLGSQDQTVVTLDEALASLKAEATPPDLR